MRQAGALILLILLVGGIAFRTVRKQRPILFRLGWVVRRADVGSVWLPKFVEIVNTPSDKQSERNLAVAYGIRASYADQFGVGNGFRHCWLSKQLYQDISEGGAFIFQRSCARARQKDSTAQIVSPYWYRLQTWLKARINQQWGHFGIVDWIQPWFKRQSFEYVERWRFPAIRNDDTYFNWLTNGSFLSKIGRAEANPRTFGAGKRISSYLICFLGSKVSFINRILGNDVGFARFDNLVMCISSQLLAFRNLSMSVVRINSGSYEGANGGNGQDTTKNQFGYWKFFFGLTALVIGISGIVFVYATAERLGLPIALSLMLLSCATYAGGLIITLVCVGIW
jgi:hypothetical protein